MRKEILRLKDILLYSNDTKSLDYLSMSLFEGEVMGVVGVAGAGKSSFMHVLAGICKPDSGQIFYNGREVKFVDALQARRCGIGYIQKDSNMIPNISIAGNILIGKRNLPKLYVNEKKENKYAKELAEFVGLHVDVSLPVEGLTYVQLKQLEIARALAGNISILVMDHPTSLLAEKEINVFNAIIRKLKSQKISTIITSHKLKEILEVSDRVAVLRNGLSMGIYKSEECSEEQLLVAMLGEDKIPDKSVKNMNVGAQSQKQELLRVEKLSNEYFSNISFSLYKGEILGLVGLSDSGKTELANTIYGVNTKHNGDIYIKGEKEIIKSPKDAIRLKIGMVPKERNGLVENLRISHNVALSSMNRVTNLGMLNKKLEDSLARRYLEEAGIEPELYSKAPERLSEEKLVKIQIAKLLAIKPLILILDEPTSEIDIIGKKEICMVLKKIKKEMGIILITSEMEDMMELFDRMLVMNKGSIVAELTGVECNPKNIIRYFN